MQRVEKITPGLIRRVPHARGDNQGHVAPGRLYTSKETVMSTLMSLFNGVVVAFSDALRKGCRVDIYCPLCGELTRNGVLGYSDPTMTWCQHCREEFPAEVGVYLAEEAITFAPLPGGKTSFKGFTDFAEYFGNQYTPSQWSGQAGWDGLPIARDVEAKYGIRAHIQAEQSLPSGNMRVTGIRLFRPFVINEWHWV
jgi:hypothetical protein